MHITTSTSAAVTIDRLRQTFACHGLPLVVVSDNATAFASSEFSAFLKGPGAPWVPGVVTAASGQICTVQLADGRIFTRHRDHVRPRVCALPSLVPGQADPAQPVPENTIPAHSARAPSALEALCTGAPAAPDASSRTTATSEALSAVLPEAVAAAPPLPRCLPGTHLSSHLGVLSDPVVPRACVGRLRGTARRDCCFVF